MKNMIKILVLVIGCVVLLLTGLLIILTITDYKPKNIEEVKVLNVSKSGLPNEFTIFDWNLGYGALGENSDFFFDGGKTVITPEADYRSYISGIKETLKKTKADIYFFQEVDIKSKRSYFLDQYSMIYGILKNYSSTFATNYNVAYVPPPAFLKPAYGKINAGLATYSLYNIDLAERYSLPGNYSWPRSILFLDRCMLVSRIKTKNGKTLVLINTHNSAYDKGGFIKQKQLEYISLIAEEEYNLGNYVIIGGDWNSYMPGTDGDTFRAKEKASEYNEPLPNNWTIDGWKWGTASNASTSRSLLEPYKKGISFEAIIDGFLISPNIEITNVENIDLGFKYSDHNPVSINLKLIDF